MLMEDVAQPLCEAETVGVKEGLTDCEEVTQAVGETEVEAHRVGVMDVVGEMEAVVDFDEVAQNVGEVEEEIVTEGATERVADAGELGVCEAT